MKNLLGIIISLGVAGVLVIFASALAQAQKAEEPAKAKVEGPDADAPFKPAPRIRPPMNLERLLPGADQDCRPCFQMEYRFIDQVCDLTPAQAKVIALEGERALQSVVRKWAEEMLTVMQAGKSRPRVDGLVIRRTLRSDLARIARKHISAEQVKRLEAEYEKRAAFLRLAGIEAVLEMIDRQLILSAGQRDEIRRSLESKWQEAWLPTPDFFVTGRLAIAVPAIPDECVVKFLTENQRNAWRNIPKGWFQLSDVGVISSSFRRDKDWLEDQVLREARQAVVQTREKMNPTGAKETTR